MRKGNVMNIKLNRKKLLLISVLLVAVIFVVSLSQFLQKNVKANSPADNAVANGLEENVQDGVILHAFNWSYNTIKDNLSEIAESGYSAVQTSPVQQPKEYDASYTKVEEQWWKLYQPLGFSIAENSWLGTRDELKELCDEADRYGIKIIVDIVTNHLGNDGTTSGLCDDVAEYVQSRVIALLKECIDCGVDGFRFESAKYIETEKDGYYGSDFWENVIGAATSYAKSAKKIDLYCYGEISGTPGQRRNYSDYTKYMSVTDNVTSDKITAYIADGKAMEVAQTTYNAEVPEEKIVLWAESYTSYMEEGGAGGYANTADISVTNINKAWALSASRKGAAAIYFARPSTAKMGEISTTNWKDAAVVAVNKFHNAYVGSGENISATDNFIVNERYTSDEGKNSGAVIINVTGKATEVVNVNVYKLADGEYYDYITGALFRVKDGLINGQIGDTGIAVLCGDVVEQQSTTVVETTTTTTMGSTAAQEGMTDFYFDASSCTWFMDNNAIPVLKVDEKDFVKMEEMDNPFNGKKIYYSKISPDTKKITIGRLIPDGKIINAYTFDYTRDYNLYMSRDDWTEGGVWSVYAGTETDLIKPQESVSNDVETTVSRGYIEKPYKDETTYVEVISTDNDIINPTNGGTSANNETTRKQNNTPTATTRKPRFTETTPETTTTPSNLNDNKETSSGMIKIYFTNNKCWDNVYCYYWGGHQDKKEVEWPGTKMSFVKNNEYSHSIYCMEIPSDVTGIVFNNGKTGSEKIQTADICNGIVNGVAFYISSNNTTGNMDVASYMYK